MGKNCIETRKYQGQAIDGDLLTNKPHSIHRVTQVEVVYTQRTQVPSTTSQDFDGIALKCPSERYEVADAKPFYVPLMALLDKWGHICEMAYSSGFVRVGGQDIF